jgi:hypothetical protein
MQGKINFAEYTTSTAASTSQTFKKTLLMDEDNRFAFVCQELKPTATK